MSLYLACIFMIAMKNCENLIVIIEIDQTF